MAAEDSSTFGLLKTLLQPPPARPSRLQRLLPCSGTMPALLEPKGAAQRRLVPWLAALRSLAQVIFINNPLSGAVLLLAFLVQSPWMAVLAVAGTAGAHLTSRALGLAPGLRNQGIHGFNGTLVGCGAAVFGRIESAGVALLWLLAVLLGGALTTVMVEGWRRRFHRRGDPPPLTLPFCLVTWLLLALPHGLPLAQATLPPLIDPPLALLLGLPRSFGQVFLCSNLGSGWLVLLATALASPLAALLGLLGALAAMLVALLLGVDSAAIAQGLWGYNGVLVSIAVGGIFHAPTRRSLVAALAGAALSAPLLLVQVALLPGLPPLTIAFVLITWGVQLVRRHTLPALLPVSLHAVVTPEEHRERYRVARSLLVAFRRNLRQRAGAPDLGADVIPEWQRRQINRMFARLDRDGDGSLSVAELQQALTAAPMAGAIRPQLEAALTALDLDGDGRIDAGEFARLIVRLQQLQEGEERLLLYLMPADADGNDHLEADELASLLASIGEPPLSDTETRLVFGPEGTALNWRGLVDRLLLT